MFRRLGYKLKCVSGCFMFDINCKHHKTSLILLAYFLHNEDIFWAIIVNSSSGMDSNNRLLVH